MYNTEDLLKTALKAITENGLIFIEDIIAYLPCHKSTFYEHFPNESDNYKTMFDMLETNRTTLKVSMRSKWYTSNAPALQMALMKLLSTPEELKKLSMQFIESENTNKNQNFDIAKIYDKEAQPTLE